MRPEPEFHSTSSGSGREASKETATAPISGFQHSTWHSPVPYLFGGLAAMMGLIALALLILACSYWKLSGYLDSDDAAGNRDDGQKRGDNRSNAQTKDFEERVLVIMAGDCKPTYLGTPTAGRAASSAPGKASDHEAEEKFTEGPTSLPGFRPSTRSSDQTSDGGSGCNSEQSQNLENKPQQ